MHHRRKRARFHRTKPRKLHKRMQLRARDRRKLQRSRFREWWIGCEVQ